MHRRERRAERVDRERALHRGELPETGAGVVEHVVEVAAGLAGELAQLLAEAARRDDLLDHQPRHRVVVADQRALGPLAGQHAGAVHVGGQPLLARLAVVAAPQHLERGGLPLHQADPVRGVPGETALPEGGRAAVPEQGHQVGRTRPVRRRPRPVRPLGGAGRRQPGHPDRDHRRRRVRALEGGVQRGLVEADRRTRVVPCGPVGERARVPVPSARNPGPPRPVPTVGSETATMTSPSLLGRCSGHPRRLGVPLAQLTLDELAGGRAREFVGEVHRAGRLVPGDGRLHVLDELGRERVGALVAVGELHDGLDLLAHLAVGDADDGDVVDRRVQRQGVLDLLRVDVHAARDDHERLAVGEVEEALLVEVADVARRRPVLVAGVLRLAGPLRVVVVLEGPLGTLEEDRADLAGGQLAASSSSGSQMWMTPSFDRPTEPGCSGHSCGEINVMPLASVEE